MDSFRDRLPHASRKATLLALLLGSSLSQALAADLAPPALSSNENIRLETGTLTVNGSSIAVTRYTWRDSANLPRSIAFTQASASNAGYALRLTWQLADSGSPGGYRTVNLDADPDSDGGFGYFVSHELYRSFSNGSSGTIAALHGEDDSPLGRYLASTGNSSQATATQGIQEFRLNYPHWGTVSTMADPTVAPSNGVGGTPVASSQHQKFNLPVVVRWTVTAGQDYPLWSVDYDLSSATGHISVDVRGPYGVLNFNEGNNPTVTALRWGDKYHFVADAGSANLGIGAAWTWNQANTGRRYQVLSAGSYEWGLVDSVSYAHSRYGDGWSDNRGLTASTGPRCPDNGTSWHLPCEYEFPYQSMQYAFGPPPQQKLAWGSAPFLGSGLTQAWIDDRDSPETIQGSGHVRYSVQVVYGKSGSGGPLTRARAAQAEASYPLSVAVSPAAGGSVTLATPWVDAAAGAQAQSNWPEGTALSLVATPAAGYTFTAWEGDCAGQTGNTCLVTLSTGRTVTARFTATAVATNGACGSANNGTFSSAPTTNLCLQGSASGVSGSGPWTWSCAGSGGGTTAQCQASVAAPQGLTAQVLVGGTYYGCRLAGISGQSSPGSLLLSCNTPLTALTSPPAGFPSFAGQSSTVTTYLKDSTQVRQCTLAGMKVDGSAGLAQLACTGSLRGSNTLSLQVIQGSTQQGYGCTLNRLQGSSQTGLQVQCIDQLLPQGSATPASSGAAGGSAVQVQGSNTSQRCNLISANFNAGSGALNLICRAP